MSDVEPEYEEFLDSDHPIHKFEYIYFTPTEYKFTLLEQGKMSNVYIEDSSGKIVKNIKLPEGDKKQFLEDLNLFLVNNVSEERIAMLTKAAKLVLQIE